ncbi:sulfatase-like hydrolase/transferase [Porticoccus sp. GXU_MW_L64]
MKSWVVCLALMTVVVAGCGGGGGSDSGTGSGVPNPVPVPDPEPTPDPGPDPDPNPDPNPPGGVDPSRPNILLIISDDQGLDSSAQYDLSMDLPNTPRLNALADDGLVFDNFWATPGCTPTRSSIITGKYGVNTGVTSIGATLPDDEVTLHSFLANDAATAGYDSALVGKWHLGGGNAADSHPNDMGIPHFAGVLGGGVNDYSQWNFTVNGQTSPSATYNTTELTDQAIDWLQSRSGPWFLWLAYIAPHAPFHLPPDDLHSASLSGATADINDNPRDYYLTAIEAMDTEIGRLLDSMEQEQRDNTVIIYIGDNGSPARVTDQLVFANGSKGSLTEGGVRVPLVVSGAGVTRQNQREGALVNSTDLFATITDLAGSSTTAIHDSQSFAGLLTDANSPSREYIYTDFDSDQRSGWAIRNDRYKLIELSDGSQTLYDLIDNPDETNNLLLSGLDFSDTVDQLRTEALQIRQGAGGGTGIPPSGDPIDITGAILTSLSANCQDYINNYQSSARDVNNNVLFAGALTISVNGDKCVIQSNGIPNHDFNDGSRSFANDVSEQNQNYQITVNPQFAAQPTPIAIGSDNGVMLNGVKIDLLAAACFGVGDERTGCNNMDQPWRFDPLFENSGFAMDSHNAHAQPNGSYHYHGSPNALFHSHTNIASPVVGFAADGFPIFGTWFDDNGTVRQATSSYRLRSGARPTGDGNPGGNYDGAFRDDYEYVDGLGDLDECNGMTVNGVYGYYITEEFPYMMACLRGEVDSTFVR